MNEDRDIKLALMIHDHHKRPPFPVDAVEPSSFDFDTGDKKDNSGPEPDDVTIDFHTATIKKTGDHRAGGKKYRYGEDQYQRPDPDEPAVKGVHGGETTTSARSSKDLWVFRIMRTSFWALRKMIRA